MRVFYLSDAHFRIFVIWDNFPFFLDRLLRDLLIFFPPTSPPTWPYPPPGFNNQKKKGGWISWRGEGLSSKSGEGKGGGAQISERGLDVDQLTPRTKSPKLTQNLSLPPSPWARVRDEIRCGAQSEHFILHNLPPRRCWYRGNLAQRHLKCASSDIHSLRFLWHKYHLRWR